MYRIKPRKFYYLTNRGQIVAFCSPVQRQLFIHTAIAQGGVTVPEAERTAAYDSIVRETRRTADLLVRRNFTASRRPA